MIGDVGGLETPNISQSTSATVQKLKFLVWSFQKRASKKQLCLPHQHHHDPVMLAGTSDPIESLSRVSRAAIRKADHLCRDGPYQEARLALE